MHSGIRIGEIFLGLMTLALGLFIGIETLMTPPLVARTVVGPGLFPGLVATGLILVGLRLLYEAFALRFVPEEVLQYDWKAVAIMAGAFLAMIFMLEYLGWVISGTFLFCAGAYAFGSRRWVVNILIGLALTLVTYFVFDYGLNLDLPMGWLVEETVLALGGDL